MSKIWTVPATVRRVVDGDTVELELDLGWHITYIARCRVAGINAPELNTPEGQRSKAYADTLMPVGTAVTFISHSLDKYGRPLGEILFANLTYLGTVMRESGNATPM